MPKSTINRHKSTILCQIPPYFNVNYVKNLLDLSAKKCYIIYMVRSILQFRHNLWVGTALEILTPEFRRHFNITRGGVMKFGEIVRDRRLELQLTQYELADMAGTTQQTLTQIERYGVEPKFTLGYKMLVALELSPEEVFKSLSIS